MRTYLAIIAFGEYDYEGFEVLYAGMDFDDCQTSINTYDGRTDHAIITVSTWENGVEKTELRAMYELRPKWTKI